MNRNVFYSILFCMPKQQRGFKFVSSPQPKMFDILFIFQEEISQVLDAMFEKFCTEGEHIIDQDDDGDNFYVIERCLQSFFLFSSLHVVNDFSSSSCWLFIFCLCLSSGTFNIFVKVDGIEKLVGCYDNRGSFGELALMYNTPRAATIIATSPGALWCLVSKPSLPLARAQLAPYLVFLARCAVSWYNLNSLFVAAWLPGNPEKRSCFTA